MRWDESYVFTVTGDTRSEPVVTETLARYPSDAPGPRANLSLMRSVALIKRREVGTGLDRALTAVNGAPGAQTNGRRVLMNMVLRTLPDDAAPSRPPATFGRWPRARTVA